MARNDLASVARKIEKMNRNIAGTFPSGTRIIGELIMTDVKASSPGHGVPVDEGTLRDSGRVDGPDGRGAVILSFGGAASAYALRQHEDLSLRHTVGEARYLVRGLERFRFAGSQAEKAMRANAEAGIRAAARG